MFDLNWLKQWWPSNKQEKRAVKAPKQLFFWALRGHGNAVVAATRSEARAAFKKLLGIPRKGRLVPGVALCLMSSLNTGK
jgi:hypothetical protein